MRCRSKKSDQNERQEQSLNHLKQRLFFNKGLREEFSFRNRWDSRSDRNIHKNRNIHLCDLLKDEENENGSMWRRKQTDIIESHLLHTLQSGAGFPFESCAERVCRWRRWWRDAVVASRRQRWEGDSNCYCCGKDRRVEDDRWVSGTLSLSLFLFFFLSLCLPGRLSPSQMFSGSPHAARPTM